MKRLVLRIVRRLTLGLSFAILITGFLVLLLWDLIVYTTPVGHTSIVWHRLFWQGDGISQGPLSEGLHIILPWDKFFTYDLRVQTQHQAYSVLSKDGLQFRVELTFRWWVISDNILILNQTVGPEYLEKLLIPEVGSVTREVIAQYTADALFTDVRNEVQEAIYEAITSDTLPNGIGNRSQLPIEHEDIIILNDVLIAHVELPKQIQTAIQNKLEQVQVAQEYRFRVERERLESERKHVEAKGIRDFQETVTPAISEGYLHWRGIEATLKLAQSPNTKVVVVGNRRNGLPLILDTTESMPDAKPAPPTH